MLDVFECLVCISTLKEDVNMHSSTQVHLKIHVDIMYIIIYIYIFLYLFMCFSHVAVYT